MMVPNSTDSGTPEIDQLGRYRLLAQLGQGGMGTIHLAVASGIGEFRKLLVVKELQRELARNESFIEMFMAEAKLAARLNHPNIVQTIEAGEQDGRYYLSMEYLDGQALTQLLKRAAIEPLVSLGTRLAVLCEVLAGLEYAHELCDFDGMPFEIVHRDINPQNVFLTYHGQVKLVDFGIAKAVDVDTLTTHGVFKGKLGYAAPEQVRGEPVDARSDLFAVGVMLWELIAMRRFASGPVTQQTMDNRVTGSEPRISDVVPTVEPVLAEICDRALQVDRDRRFSSAAEFRKALERFLFVSGEAPAMPLGALLQTKFDAERKAMHRLIDAFAKRDDQYRSVVRNLTAALNGESASAANPKLDGTRLDGNNHAAAPRIHAVTPPQRDEGATQVSHFSHPLGTNVLNAPRELDPPLEWNGSLRRSRKVVPWMATAIALLLGSYWAWQTENSSKAGPVAAAAAGPLTDKPAPVIEPQARVAVEAAPVELAPLAAAVDAPPPTAPKAISAAGARPARAERQRRASPPPHPGGSVSTRVQASAASAANDQHAAPQPVRSREAAPEKTQTEAPAGRAQVAAGQDLRELPKSNRRPIDLEDPFR